MTTSTAATHPPAVQYALTLAAVAVGGALLSVQARMNGQLGVVFDAPITAALWSFGSGLVLLSLWLLLRPSVRAALAELWDRVRTGRFAWWLCVGGASGGLFVAIQAYAVPLIGVAVYSIALVGGQTGNALVVDRIGLGPGGRTPVTGWRVLAALVAVVGVALAATQRSGGSAVAVLLLPTLLVFLAGAMNTMQQAINGRVGVVTRNPMATTWLNFATGTVCLLVLVAGYGLAGGRVVPLDLEAPWWAWFGAPCGIYFIAVASVAVRVLGVLVFTLMLLVGQLGAAVVLDLTNPAMRDRVGAQVYLGILVTGAAVALGAWSTLAARRRA